MAISRYVTSKTYNMTEFYNWLLTKKSETFLKSVDIDVQVASSNKSSLILSTDDVSITIIACSHTRWESSDIIIFQGNRRFSYATPGVGESSPNMYLSGALLCNNGLLIELLCEQPAIKRYVAISLDNNNHLSMCIRSGGMTAISDSYDSLAYGSTDLGTVTLAPKFNSPMTAIGSVVPITNDNTLIPNMYVALNTQQASQSLAAITFGGETFISDGYFYIKD